MQASEQSFPLSVVLPCLNEAETLASVIHEIRNFESKNNFRIEIVVADNGSQDESPLIARQLGAKVIDVPLRGYGSVLREGIQASSSNYVIIADADGSYALDDLGHFLERLDEGFELVMGNRFKGGISPGAMPWMHKYVGNPILSWIGRLFFKVNIFDFHCGMRGLNRDAILSLNLKSNGFEYATEMVVKASFKKLRITEVPTILRPDGRSRPPHLRTWRDGWRHLIFLLAASPRWLFLYPGVCLLAAGLIGMFSTLLGSIYVGSLRLGLNTYFISLGFVLVGIQTVLTAFLARIFSIRLGVIPNTKSSNLVERTFTLERGILAGLSLIFGALIASALIFYNWFNSDFRNLNPDTSLRISGIFILFFSAGLQLIFASFFASMLQDY
jgi:glycosyltransferase involved in cell wall biosynthesis